MTKEKIDSKPVVAIFDIDKTILPGYSIIDFASFLAKQERFDGARWTEIESIIQEYKRKAIDYNTFADAVVETYALGISGQLVEEISDLSTEFWSERLTTVFPFIHLIMNELAEMNAEKIAISGSTLESLSPILTFFEFDKVFATQIEIEDGRYTNKVKINAASQSQKEIIVAAVMEEVPQESL